MIIEVYQRHIDRGFGGKGSELLCPIAVAMTEQLGVRIGVWDGKAFIISTAEYYELPENAHQMYLKYDKGRPMKPFSFEIGEKKAPLPKIAKEETAVGRAA
jgi:hypothetical protein